MPAADQLAPAPGTAPDVLVVHTVTGTVLTQLDGVTGSISDDLAGDNIRGRFAVPVRPGLRHLLTPWRCSIAVADTERVWWAGPITDPPSRGRGGVVEVTCGSVWSLLAMRPAWRAGQRPPSPDADLAYQGLSLRGIASELLVNALNYGPLPIAVPGVQGGWNERSWPSHELPDTAEALRSLVDDTGDGGPRIEVHFNPRWAGASGNRIEWEARLGDPFLDGGEHAWDTASDAVRALTENGAGASVATHAWVGGAGQDEARVIGHAATSELTSGGWPALHAIDTAAGSTLTDQALADAVAGTRTSTVAPLALVPVVDAWGQDRAGVPTAPVFGQWALGDRARFDVTGDPWTPEGTYLVRLAAWAHSLGGRDVALSITDR